MATLHALLAVIRRNLAIATRRKDLIVQAVAVPIVVLTLASIIFGASDAWPIAVIDKDNTTASRQLVTALNDTKGARGPYYRIIETDPSRARKDLTDGRIQLAIEIPRGFERDRTLHTSTYNINTDTMKNVRLRLVTTANLYDERVGLAQIHVTFAKAKPVDVSRTAFMGGSAIILALLLGCALIAANLFAMEQEIRTTKEIILSPLGAPIASVGAALAACALSLITAIPTGIMALLFGFRSGPLELARGAVIVLPAMLAAAGVGVQTAQGLRTHRAIQPVIILLALGTYFAAGGFTPVPGLPPIARGFSSVWPPSFVFEWANPLLHGFTTELPWTRLLALTIAAAVGLAVASWSGRREILRPAHGGQ